MISSLGLVAGVDAEGQFALSGILCSECDGGHHHSFHAVEFVGEACCVNGYVVAQDGVGEIGQVQIVGLGGSPRKYGYLIVGAPGCAVVADAQIVNLVDHC